MIRSPADSSRAITRPPAVTTFEQEPRLPAVVDGDEHIRHDRAHDGCGELFARLDGDDATEAAPSEGSRERFADDRLCEAAEIPG